MYTWACGGGEGAPPGWVSVGVNLAVVTPAGQRSLFAVALRRAAAACVASHLFFFVFSFFVVIIGFGELRRARACLLHILWEISKCD